jgi:hypothetical protein
MLGGCASNRPPFAPALAIRSGAMPQIGIYSPGVSNALGGCALHWYSFVPTLSTCSGATSSNPMLAIRSGATPYAVNLSSLLNHRQHSVCYVDFSSTYSGSTTTSPTASIRQHHYNDSATVQLHRPRHARTSFGALTRDMQDYDFKARLESLPDSMNRLDTRGLVTRERTLGSSILPTYYSPRTRWTFEAQEVQD